MIAPVVPFSPQRGESANGGQNGDHPGRPFASLLPAALISVPADGAYEPDVPGNRWAATVEIGNGPGDPAVLQDMSDNAVGDGHRIRPVRAFEHDGLLETRSLAWERAQRAADIGGDAAALLPDSRQAKHSVDGDRLEIAIGKARSDTLATAMSCAVGVGGRRPLPTLPVSNLPRLDLLPVIAGRAESHPAAGTAAPEAEAPPPARTAKPRREGGSPRIVLEASSGGEIAMIHVNGLPQEERDRLRATVAGLLSRHGRAIAAIRIMASNSAETFRQGENQ
ncbi:hypothetical protein [Sphingosinithalassobacter portus]|uniref:hypothetical protein n=1 Tax=Stakelama portus TaxID=2676234 RepID=UPI0011AB7D39|nr:hypothetical protein [Sphingosinithalassobacter portus]